MRKSSEITFKQLFKAYAKKSKRNILNAYSGKEWMILVAFLMTPLTSIHGSKFNPVTLLLLFVVFEIMKSIEAESKGNRRNRL